MDVTGGLSALAGDATSAAHGSANTSEHLHLQVGHDVGMVRGSDVELDDEEYGDEDAIEYEDDEDEETGSDEDEESGSNTDMDMREYGIYRALPVKGNGSDMEDYDGPPLTAEDYLRQVRREAAGLPDVTTADIDPRRFDGRRTAYVSGAAQHALVGGRAVPPASWLPPFLSSFHATRQQLERMRETLPTQDTSGLPDMRDEEAWRQLCLGCAGEGTHVTHMSCDQSLDLPSTMNLLGSFSQAKLITLLRYHVGWLASVPGLPDIHCKWLYAVCALLDTPLHDSTEALLRDLLRHCARVADFAPMPNQACGSAALPDQAHSVVPLPNEAPGSPAVLGQAQRAALLPEEAHALLHLPSQAPGSAALPDQVHCDVPLPEQAGGMLGLPDQAHSMAEVSASAALPGQANGVGQSPDKADVHMLGISHGHVLISHDVAADDAIGGMADLSLGEGSGRQLPDQTMAGDDVMHGVDDGTVDEQMLARVHVMVAIAGAYFRQDEGLAASAGFLSM